MPLRVRCPGCESLYRLSDHLLGKTVRCKSCSVTFKVADVLDAATEDVPMPKAAAKRATVPPADDDDLEAAPVEAETDAIEDETPEEKPKRKGKPEKPKSGRKRSPVMLLLIGIGVLVVGGGAAAWLLGYFSPSQPLKAPQSQPKGISQPKQQGGAKNTGKAPDGGEDAKDEMEKKDNPAKDEPLPTENISYVNHVKPFLTNYCGKCHGAKMPKAGINLASFEGIMRGGKGKQPILLPGDPDQSALVLAVEHKGRHNMPPPKEKAQPSEAQKEMLRKWVSEGAKDDSTKAGAWLPENAVPGRQLADTTLVTFGLPGDPHHLPRQAQEQIDFHLSELSFAQKVTDSMH
jgi:predicted Zn finger-like uncharacterized protein